MIQSGNGEWFLGRVDFDVTKKNFTRLSPIAVIAPDHSGWERVGDDIKDLFPTRGCVCWFSAPLDAREDTIFEFQANPIFDPAKGPDKRQIRIGRVATEIIDVRHLAESKVREHLTGKGLALDRRPSGQCLFKLASDRWVGPFQLTESKQGHWIVPSDLDLDAVPVFTSLPAAASDVMVEGKPRTILVSAGATFAPHRLANWQTDAVVLAGVLRRLHKLDVGRFKKLDLTYAAFDEYVAAVAAADLLPDQQLARDRARAERVKELRHQLPLANEVVEAIVSALEKFDGVKGRIEGRLAELKEVRKAEIESHISAERAELEKLQRSTEKARGELDGLANLIEQRRKALHADLLSTDKVMQEKLREIREAPSRFAAELLTSSAILPALLKKAPAGRSEPVLKPVSAPSSSVVDDVQKLRVSLSREFLRAGVAPDSMFPLLSAFAAGLTPVCADDGANAALRAVARIVCGGNAWWLPVSPATTGIQDILTPASGRQPVIAGLADVIETAREHPETLMLAVLEGVDLAPSECFLLPLIEYTQTAENRLGGTMPLLTRDGRPIDVWPRNLLLAFTVTRGTIALPLPRRAWEHAPLFAFGWSPVGTEIAEAESVLSHCPPARLIEIQSASSRSTHGHGGDLTMTNPPARRLAARLYHAEIALGSAPLDAWQLVLTHAIAPAVAGIAGNLPAGSSDAAVKNYNLAKLLVDNPSAA